MAPLGGYTFGAVTEQNSASASPFGPPKPRRGEAPEGAVTEVVQALEDVGGFSMHIALMTLVGVVAYFGELAVLLGQALRAFPRINPVDLLRQMSVIGVDTIPIAVLTVGFSGAVLSLYSTDTLSNFGVSNLVGGIVALSIIRETGPILAGVVAAARAGSAMTAEIGSMKVTEQIDALRSMAISPVEYLVAPRVLAALLMMPVLTLFADAAGVFGGAIVASTKGVPVAAYVDSIHQILTVADVARGLLKTGVFGAIVALIGCREGLATEGGAVGVGQATTRSVVLSIVLIFVANFILSFILYNTNLV